MVSVLSDSKSPPAVVDSRRRHMLRDSPNLDMQRFDSRSVWGDPFEKAVRTDVFLAEDATGLPPARATKRNRKKLWISNCAQRMPSPH